MSDTKELSEQVAHLTSIVNKQSKLLAQTGQKLIELQIKDVKGKIRDHEPAADLSDYVSNEDIVQLVGELQSLLDDLETRSIKRLFNSKLVENDGIISALSNKDGEVPEKFPETYGEFKKLSKEDLLEFSLFYELLVADTDEVSEAVKVEMLEKLEEKEEAELFDELSRYLGLVVRRSKGVW